MKKIIIVLLLLFLLVGCEGSTAVKPLKSASIQDNEYNSIVVTYMTDVKEKVQNGDIFISENYLYLVPVGSDLSANCTAHFIGTPYGSSFIYAYVGVVKYGGNYSYFFVSKDSEGYGYNFNSYKQIEKEDGAYCYSGDILYTYDALASYYNKDGTDFTEVDISSIDVESSMSKVLNFRNLTKARIYYYSVCNK